MAYHITNNSAAPRGIWSKGRLVWIDPGATKTFQPDNPASVKRIPSLTVRADTGDLPPPPADLRTTIAQLDHDRDGKPGGSKAAPVSDNLPALRAEYQAKLGKKPFPGWPAEELRRRIDAA